MKKVLFIDRDGTLILEPPITYQIDSLEKLEFYPRVFQWLSRIYKELDFEFVMVTNQDGLGTESFPESDFWPAHKKMIKAFESEGVYFQEVLIDRTFPEDNAPTRKPRVGLLSKYIYGNYDLEDSFVIGDRETDVELAENLKCKSILLGEASNKAHLVTRDWADVYKFLSEVPRTAKVSRTTKETDIDIELSLDGSGQSDISTGIGFFDHMLDQISVHGQFDLKINVKGDLEVDEHHTIEDVAISLGQVFDKCLGSKKAIERYGFTIPMDDCLAQVSIDFGGRPWLVWDANFKREYVGKMPTEMFAHFFKSFSDHAKCNLNIKAEGVNEHHKIESIFKAFARAASSAVSKNQKYLVPSSKGVL